MNRIETLFENPTPASEDDVSKFEGAIGRRLPSEFRDYLLKWNNSIPERSCFELDGTSVYVQSIYTLEGEESGLHWEFQVNPAKRGLFRNRIPVATANGGDALMLNLKNGKIYLWEHETDKTELICESWNQVLENLQDDFE